MFLYGFDIIIHSLKNKMKEKRNINTLKHCLYLNKKPVLPKQIIFTTR